MSAQTPVREQVLVLVSVLRRQAPRVAPALAPALVREWVLTEVWVQAEPEGKGAG